ncbi:MAG: hypothetical protein E7Z77_04015 [Methanobrevibacter sp.]|uniref:hypothetical protein n=1 Tax=Methanobrevibacter sp. TaxID=66852 RepID=UPI0025ED4FC1|nr:hypothetical protein [Methanobrevibacter sp.]MBE6508562.1 hypothetical protein [Methanobrevibacter sp.]
MKFKTLEDYDNYLENLEKELKDIDEYLKEHPEKQGSRGNYETIKYIHDIYKNNKLKFIQSVNEINLKLGGNQINNPLSIEDVYLLGNEFNNTKKSTMTLLEVNPISNEDLFVEEISKGFYNIKFSFPNPNENDVKRISLRKKGLMKIFDFINCGDDIEKLKREAGPEGREALIAYRKFLTEIVKNKADFTLDTEMGNIKAGLTLRQCENICENLK